LGPVDETAKYKPVFPTGVAPDDCVLSAEISVPASGLATEPYPLVFRAVSTARPVCRTESSSEAPIGGDPTLDPNQA
jgi:hypothetical protein